MKDILNQDSSGHRQSLSTAVARVYLSTLRSQHTEWKLLITGVVCLIKDFDRRSYYITVSDNSYRYTFYDSNQILGIMHGHIEKNLGARGL